jgi:transketolase
MNPLAPARALELDRVRAVALQARQHCIEMAARGGCFLGAALSCVDILTYLYTTYLRLSPERLEDPERDYLLLSKGHAVPALYGVLAALGYIPEERLHRHLQPEDAIYWHPNRSVPGVEFHFGSLGHGMAVALGIALECRLRRSPNRVVVLLGDGELNEGSVWEAALVAAAYRVEQLIAVIDRNRLQANMPTEELIPLEPIAEKFRAFGWGVLRVDGHDPTALHAAFSALPERPEHPSVIIADTVRGKGLPSMENRVDRWFCAIRPEELPALLAELHGGAAATLSSAGSAE